MASGNRADEPIEIIGLHQAPAVQHDAHLGEMMGLHEGVVPVRGEHEPGIGISVLKSDDWLLDRDLPESQIREELSRAENFMRGSGIGTLLPHGPRPIGVLSPDDLPHRAAIEAIAQAKVLLTRTFPAGLVWHRRPGA